MVIKGIQDGVNQVKNRQDWTTYEIVSTCKGYLREEILKKGNTRQGYMMRGMLDNDTVCK